MKIISAIFLSLLLLPAAFLFERGRRWGILLPLCSWAPAPLMPLVAIAALLVPFLAREPEPGSLVATERKGVPVPDAAV